jgi:hypothetical protein
MTIPNPSGAQSKATTILVLGILGIVCCGLLAPVAWYMGKNEVRLIEAGHLPAASLGTAKAGMICGIVGTILLALTCLWVFIGGGMAILQGIAAAGGN